MYTAEKTQDIERLITQTIRPFVKELRMVDLADYVAFLHFDKHHQVADIVDSAAEQFFAPGFLVYRETGSIEIDWGQPARVVLELAMNAPGITYEFTLELDDEAARVSLGYINRAEVTVQAVSPFELLLRSVETNSFAA